MKSRFACLTTAFLLLPGSVLAQNPLDEVEALAGQGRILQARELLLDWWDGEGKVANRMDRQRSIWLRGSLTVDPSMAELDYRRLALEFPGGPFSDDALLRLGQSAAFSGDLRQANTHFLSLERDYPSSPLRAQAQAWLRANDSAVQALGPPPPIAPDPAPGPIFREDDEPGEGPFSVQAGAFRNLDGARTLAAGLRASGFRPRIVRTKGSDFIRVRVGRFPGRDEASGLLRELAGAGFEAAIVSDAQSEEEVG